MRNNARRNRWKPRFDSIGALMRIWIRGAAAVEIQSRAIEKHRVRSQRRVPDRRLMPKEGVGLLYGASQTFKSFVAMHMATHIARGAPWAGRKTEGGLSCLYRRGRRIGAAEALSRIGKGRACPGVRGSHSHSYRRRQTLGREPGIASTHRHDQNHWQAWSRHHRHDRQSYGLPMRTASECRSSSKTPMRWAKRFGCFVLAIHHTGWDATGRPRGWSGSTPGVDVQMLSERVNSRSSRHHDAKAQG